MIEWPENSRLKSKLDPNSAGFHHEHEKLQSLLNNLEKYGEKYENKEEVFRYIRFELEKQFYFEEKAFLFPNNNLRKVLSPKITRALIHQHDKLLEACKIVETCKEMRTSTKLRKFQELLTAHFDFEEKYIYHQFQRELQPIPQVLRKSANTGFYPLEELRKYQKTQMKDQSDLANKNRMKAMSRIQVKKILRSLFRSQYPTSTNSPSK